MTGMVFGDSRTDVADRMADAIADWLKFDANVEPPAPSAPYAELVAYEQSKFEFTEQAAEALAAYREAKGR